MSECFKTFSKNILLYIAGACCCEVLISVLIHSEMQKKKSYQSDFTFLSLSIQQYCLST